MKYHPYFSKLLETAADVVEDVRFTEQYPDVFPPEVMKMHVVNDIWGLTHRITTWVFTGCPIWESDLPDEDDADDEDNADDEDDVLITEDKDGAL